MDDRARAAAEPLTETTLAVALAALPETIRGYGPIKMKAIAAAGEERRHLLDLWRAPPERRQAAE
jgi:hypothetical protein